MKRILFCLFILLLIISCSKNKIQQTSISKNDPFKNTVAQTQFHRIDTSKDTIIIGTSGTRITIQKESFLNSKGKVIDSVNFELLEALKLEDMLLSNLTTTSNGKILETDGMIYFNVLDDRGNELKINPEKPLYIEIPTKKNKANMQLYEGERDEYGNMNWINPKPLQNNLTTVPLDELDFLPPNFEEKVKHILKKDELSEPSIDSIYYAFSYQSGFVYYNNHYKIDILLDYGIDPSLIKVLKSKEYENTYIATKAFERRLKAIHSTCSDSITAIHDEILKVYAKNLEKDLWKVDLIADSLVNSLPSYESDFPREVDSLIIKKDVNDGITQKVENRDNTFLDFSKEKLLNVKTDNEHLKQLNSFFEKQLELFYTEYNNSLKNTQKEKIKENPKLEEFTKKEKKLKKKRETNRMESYGFVTTESGWYNIDTGVIPKSWNYQYILVNLAQPNKYKTVHVYSVFKSKKVITKLASYNQNKTFEFDKSLELIQIPKNNEVAIVIIASNDEEHYYNSSAFMTKKEDNAINSLEMELSASKIEQIKSKLKELDDFSPEASVIEEYKLSDTIQKIKYSEFEKGRKTDSINIELKKAVFPCYESEVKKLNNIPKPTFLPIICTLDDIF